MFFNSIQNEYYASKMQKHHQVKLEMNKMITTHVDFRVEQNMPVGLCFAQNSINENDNRIILDVFVHRLLAGFLKQWEITLEQANSHILKSSRTSKQQSLLGSYGILLNHLFRYKLFIYSRLVSEYNLPD